MNQNDRKIMMIEAYAKYVVMKDFDEAVWRVGSELEGFVRACAFNSGGGISHSQAYDSLIRFLKELKNEPPELLQ